jgi:ribosomal protein S27AE
MKLLWKNGVSVIFRKSIITLNFLAKRRLLLNNVECPNCAQPCNINKYQQGVNGFRWMCSKCRKFSQSIRKRSFFENSHLSLANANFAIHANFICNICNTILSAPPNHNKQYIYILSRCQKGYSAFH